MLKIVLQVDSDNIIGVKETLKAYCEKFHDTKVVSVEKVAEQMKFSGKEK